MNIICDSDGGTNASPCTTMATDSPTRTTFASTMRLIWIDAVLERGLMLRRSDLCTAFGISVPQASTDLREFGQRFPSCIRYDRSAKGFFRNGDKPAFDMALHHPVLTAQAAVQAAGS